MAVRISDSGLSRVYSGYERALQDNPNLRLGHQQVLEILAQVGTSSDVSPAKMLRELSRPDLSRDHQIALARRGMTPTEKRDLESILDAGMVPLEPSAKEFLEAVVGRDSPRTGLTIAGDQRNGLNGLTRAGTAIEPHATTVAAGRRHILDAIAQTVATGKFAEPSSSGEQAVSAGDLIRLRARYASGETADWVTVRAHGIEAKDSGPHAVVALFRVGLAEAGRARVAVSNIDASRPVAKPGAVLQFTNQRTHEHTRVTITESGGFPAGFQIAGAPGDVFSVAASDGVNNLDFSARVGNLTVPGREPGTVDLIPDPLPHRDDLNPDGSPRFGKRTFTGPLFLNQPSAENVIQGSLCDSYLPAAVAAVAHANPELITNMICDNADGTYTVVFKERDWSTGQFQDVIKRVDGDLYVRNEGGAVYGHSPNSSDPKAMELWFPLIEKAYADWRGSYDAIGDGGLASDVMEVVTGRFGRDLHISDVNAEGVWAELKRQVDAHSPVAAGTYGESQQALYTNTGIYPDHAYSVLGYEVDEERRYIVLRNPWGYGEPVGNGKNDGIFRLRLEDFVRLFQNLMYTE